MRKLIYSMGVSLDGFIAGPDGDIGWTEPDEELHRFHNERVRGTGAHLLVVEAVQLLVRRRPVDLAVGPGDEAVQRHTHRVDQLPHRGWPIGGHR